METDNDPQDFVSVFDRIAPYLSEEIGGPAFLIKVIGPRWSYVAGYVPDELPFSPPERVMLSAEWAVLYYPQEGRKITPDKVKAMFVIPGEPGTGG